MSTDILTRFQAYVQARGLVAPMRKHYAYYIERCARECGRSLDRLTPTQARRWLMVFHLARTVERPRPDDYQQLFPVDDALLPLTVPHLFCAKGGEVPTWAWDLVEDRRQHPDPLVSALALIADGRAMAVEPALRDALLCLGRSQVRARIIAALPPSACDQERALSLLQDGDPEVCSALLGHLGSCSDQDWARDAILPLIHCGSSYFSQDVRREALVLALGHDLPGAPAWARGLVQSGSRSRAAAEARSWCVEQITVTDALLLDIGGIDSDDDGNPFESLHDLRSGCRMNVPARMRQLADTLEADADEQTVAAHAGRRLVISIDDWEPRHEDGAVHGTLLRQLLTSCDVVFCAADGHHLVAEVQPGLRDAPLLAALFEAATCVLLRARWF